MGILGWAGVRLHMVQFIHLCLIVGSMAKGTRDLILRDRLQFDVDAAGDTDLLYGRVDMSDFVNVVKREGFAVKEVRYHLRDPGNPNGVLDPLLVGAAGSLWDGDIGIVTMSPTELTADQVWQLYISTRGYYNE